MDLALHVQAPAERISVVSGQHQALVVVDGQELPEETGDLQLDLLHGQAEVVWPGLCSKITGSHCCGRRWVLCGKDLCCGDPVVWRWFHNLLGQEAERSVALNCLHQGQAGVHPLETPAERISVVFGQHQALTVVVVPALDVQELPDEETGDIQLGLFHARAVGLHVHSQVDLALHVQAPAERISVVSGQHQTLEVVDGQELPEETGDLQLGLHHGQAVVVRPGQWSKMTGSHCCGRRWVLCGKDLCCGIPVVWRWFYHLLGKDAGRSVAPNSAGSAPI